MVTALPDLGQTGAIAGHDTLVRAQCTVLPGAVACREVPGAGAGSVINRAPGAGSLVAHVAQGRGPSPTRGAV